jgi:hypothetical protein
MQIFSFIALVVSKQYGNEHYYTSSSRSALVRLYNAVILNRGMPFSRSSIPGMQHFREAQS